MTRPATADRRPRPYRATGLLAFVWAVLLAAPGGAAIPGIDHYPRAAAAIGAQRLVVAAADELEVPRLFVAALAGPSVALALQRTQAHMLMAVGASRDAAAAWKRIDAAAVRIADHVTHAEALTQLAATALLLGDYPSSRRHAQALLAMSGNSDEGAPVQRAIALGYLGTLSRRSGDLEAALAFHTRAIAILRESGDEVHLARALSSLGTVLRDRGDFAGSLDAHLQALDLRERTRDQLETSYRNIALLYREIEDEQAARDYFTRALEASSMRSDPETYASVLGSYASLLNDVGDHAAALAAAEEGLIIDIAVGSRSHEGLQNLEAGRALLGLGRGDEAGERLQSALAIGREIRQSEIIARSLLHLAEQAQGARDPMRARGYIDEAIAGLESNQLRPQLAQAYAIRERIALSQHDTEAALRYAHRHSEQRELLLGTRASRQLSALQARYARAEAGQKLALLQKDNELQAANLRAQELQRRLGMVALASLALLLALAIWRYASMGRLNRALALKNAEIDAQREALTRANAQLSERADALYLAAISDPLTGVFNRTHLREQLERRLVACLADGRELAVLVVDFDHFKQINDMLGHLFGDRVLVAGVAAMRDGLEPDDLLGRFGGEEFVIALEDRDADAARTLAEALRERVRSALASVDRRHAGVTVSIGLAMLSQLRDPSVDGLLDAGDRAMYAAKAAGRNRVVRFAEAA